MNKPELLDLIIAAIDAARKEQQRPLILLRLTPENGLEQHGKGSVLEALEDFQVRERVIRLSEINFPERRAKRTMLAANAAFASTGSGRLTVPVTQPAKPDPALQEFLEEPSTRENAIILETLQSFDNWLASYRLRTRDDLDQITPLTLAKVCLTILDISEKLEASGQPTMNIYARFQYTSPFFPQSFIPSDYRKDALDYMKNKGIVTSYKITYFAANGGDASVIAVTVDIPKFQEFKARACAVYVAKERELAPPQAPKEVPKPQPVDPESNTDVVYEVKFTSAREILINGFLLTKLDFNSENDNIFDHIFRNPNKLIGIGELKPSLGGADPKKALSKIIENCGFTRELKKLFFNISKTSVFFRNPIRRKDLDDSGLGRLKLQRR